MTRETSFRWTMITLAIAIAMTVGRGHCQTIDAGGPTDDFFTGGETWTFPGVAGDATVRYGPSGPFSYALPCTIGSVYSVTLNMVDGSQTAAGMRVFNVSLNGQAILTAFDLFAAAGNAPTSRTFPALCYNGALTLVFSTVKRSALVSSIEYHPVAATPPGTQLILGARQVVEKISLGDPAWAAAIAGGATSISYTLQHAPATGTAIVWNFNASAAFFSTTSAVIATSPASGQLTVALPTYRPFAAPDTLQDVVTILYWTLDPP